MTNLPGNLSVLFQQDPGSNPRNVPSYVSARNFAAAGHEEITIPNPNAGSGLLPPRYVRIACTVDCYYSFAGNASVPADTDDGSACELIKAQSNAEWLQIPQGATVLSLAVATAGIATASFFTA